MARTRGLLTGEARSSVQIGARSTLAGQTIDGRGAVTFVKFALLENIMPIFAPVEFSEQALGAGSSYSRQIAGDIVPAQIG